MQGMCKFDKTFLACIKPESFLHVNEDTTSRKRKKTKLKLTTRMFFLLACFVLRLFGTSKADCVNPEKAKEEETSETEKSDGSHCSSPFGCSSPIHISTTCRQRPCLGSMRKNESYMTWAWAQYNHETFCVLRDIHFSLLLLPFLPKIKKKSSNPHVAHTQTVWWK